MTIIDLRRSPVSSARSGGTTPLWPETAQEMDISDIPEITPERFPVEDVAGFKAHLTEHGCE